MVSVKVLSMSTHKLMCCIHCEMILSLALPSVEALSLDHVTSVKKAARQHQQWSSCSEEELSVQKPLLEQQVSPG